MQRCQDPDQTWRDPGLKGTGSGGFKPPYSPPLHMNSFPAFFRNPAGAHNQRFLYVSR